MRESNIGHELKDMAQEVVRFGERCVQAGREWLNERRDEMNHRNDESRRGYQSVQGSDRPSEASRSGKYGYDNQSDRNRTHAQGYAQGELNRNRGEYYGDRQFDQRTQSAGWDEERGGEWDYDGGPERFSTTGYGESGQQGYRQSPSQGRQYGSQSGGRGEYNQDAGSDYYRGRQGYGAQGSFGSEYDTYGRNQGYGEGSAYTRSQSGMQGNRFSGRQGYGTSNRYGGESAGYGGRGSLQGNQGYYDEGEMSGYGGRELSTQQYGSSSSGRYGTAPGQYGYGGYGSAGNFRGVGPKNYTRSDERLTEEINERLTDDDDLDASEITVRVANGAVTLEGNVDQRWMKHRAEDIADACSGVKEVDNRIQVTSGSSTLGQTTGTARASSTSRASQAATPSAGTTGSSGTTPH